MTTRHLERRDRLWAAQLVREHFGSSRVAAHGKLYDSQDLPGFVAESDSAPVGLLQYRVESDQAEIVIVVAIRRRTGIGRTLMQAFRRYAHEAGIRRIWLITTNNNRAAQAFYEAIGMRRCAVYPNAVVEARKLKPELPEYDEDGVAIRDELEYEWP